MNEKINNMEPQEIEQFLIECHEKAQELGITLFHYLEEFVLD
tara:strand:+ start:22 stop:147 length:126 start_codon:yes stop_codon:yes gene_type:complete